MILFFCSLLLPLWPQVVEEVSSAPEQYSATPVPGGASNKNYHLSLDKLDYFIRFSPKAMESLYADLSIEYEVLKACSSLGICPKPIYHDPKKRVLVTEFIDHDKQAIDLEDPLVRQKVFQMLHAIVDSGVSIRRTFCPYEDVCKLSETARKLGCEPLSDEYYSHFLPALKEIDAALSHIPRKSLCHLDLHNKNLLKRGERYWIIDWEYATMSHPFLVLASMASIERWDDDQMHKILNEYMNPATRDEYYCLYLYRIVIDIFWTTWNHIQGHISTIDNPYSDWEALFYEAASSRLHSQLFREALSFYQK